MDTVDMPPSQQSDEWSRWIGVVKDFADGVAHSVWFDSEVTDVLLRIAGGWGRLRLEIATSDAFSEADRLGLAGRGLLPVTREPSLALVTEPPSGVVVNAVIVHEETWIWTGSANDLQSMMQTAFWGLTNLMCLRTSDSLLIQVVQRDRSCERCWEVVAHDYPY